MSLLQTLRQYGQSVWLDGLERNWMLTDRLQRAINNGLRGVISNFTSLERAIRAGSYERDFWTIQRQPDMNAQWLYEYLMVQDIQLAADRMKATHTQTHANDGFVNLDLPPQIMHDPQTILAEARRLWRTVGWSNLMLKTPATAATVSIIEQLIDEGININVTMLFSQSVYEQVAEAYLRGLETLVMQGKEVSTIACVVSVPINRLDEAFSNGINTLETSVDRLHDAISLGIRLAKVIYQRYQTIYQGDRWQVLARLGAQPQRLLWDISNFKNDRCRSQHYIESLVSAGTVLLFSPQTLQEQEHYNPSYNNFTMNIDAAYQTLEHLELIVSLETIADTLLTNELQRSQQKFAQLLKTISAKRNSQGTQ